MSDENNSTYEERVRDLLIDDIQWTGPRAELTDDLPLIENRLIDSLGVMRLVGRLESEFDIVIRDEDVVLANLGSIERIAAFFASRQG
jgi:acyl carrier protein